MDKLILCVDFDGTIVQDAFPNIGEPRQGRFHRTFLEDLIYLQKKGHKIILWTCREGEHLEQAVAFCKERGLEFDAVNDDLFNRVKGNLLSKKPCCENSNRGGRWSRCTYRDAYGRPRGLPAPVCRFRYRILLPPPEDSFPVRLP